MSQPHQPNQRLKLTQEEGLLVEYGYRMAQRAQMAWGYYSWSPVSATIFFSIIYYDFFGVYFSKSKILGFWSLFIIMIYLFIPYSVLTSPLEAGRSCHRLVSLLLK